MSGALEGVVVVDLTTEYWASLASAMLADFGARVIRVEDLSVAPRNPDRDGQHPPETFDSEAELIHRNKESVALALAEKAGSDLLGQLVARADVLLTDASAPRLEAWGLAEEALLAERPDLVYAVGSLSGPLGPETDLPPLDELAAARSGVMHSLPEPGQPPVNASAGQMYTSVMLALGIVTALHHRNETGRGQRVDASLLAGHMYASTLTLDAYMAMREDSLGEPRARFEAANPMSGISYPSQDGRWVTLTMPDTDRWWPAFSKIVGLAENDERFDTHDKRCGESRLAMMHALEAIFVTRPAAEWRACFDAENLSADIIERYDYPALDENARRNRYVMEIEHPDHGTFKSLGFPIHMSETPAALHRLAPKPGENTDSVLEELSEMDASASPSPRPAGQGEGQSPARPLEGLRVLDATVWFQGPVCAQYLADMGAEVIHVERPVTGDQARGVRSIAAVPVADWNQYFLAVNRNKKSIAVDLKKDEGRDLIHRLVAKSDVFLWNQGLESLEGLGLDFATLSALNPRLIYATNSGYGTAGSVNKPSFDMTVQALTGIMARLGEPGQPPIYLGLGAGDAYGGLMGALGILLALHHRDRTGLGQSIDASLYGAQLFLAAPSLQPFLATGKEEYGLQQARAAARNPLWNRYRAEDAWLAVCAENTDPAWQSLTGLDGVSGLSEDERFRDAAGRRDNNASLVTLLDEVFARRPASDWVDALNAAGLPAARIDQYRDLAEDEHAWANGYFSTVHCDEAGEEVAIRGLPIGLGATPGRVDALGPELGQDTELLLFDVLGLDWDRIGELKELGVIP